MRYLKYISIDGRDLPPAIVLSDMRRLENFIKYTNLSDQHMIPISKTRYSNTMIAYHWIHHLYYFTHRGQVGAKDYFLIPFFQGQAAKRTLPIFTLLINPLASI